jgi:hypothetical protein
VTLLAFYGVDFYVLIWDAFSEMQPPPHSSLPLGKPPFLFLLMMMLILALLLEAGPEMNLFLNQWAPAPLGSFE